MSRFHEIFTVTDTFMLHGIKVNFASVTIMYDEDAPSMARAIAAKFLRPRLRQYVGLQDEAYAGDKLLAMLNDENNIAKYAWRHFQEQEESKRETRSMLVDYYASRGC